MKAIFENKHLSLIAKQLDGIKAYVPMFHPHIEILCVTSGEAEVMVDGEKRTLFAGDCCVVFPYCVHAYHAAPAAKAVLIMFDAAFLHDFSPVFMSSKPKEPFFKTDAHRQNLLEQVLKYAKEENPMLQGALKGYLGAFVGEVLAEMPLIAADNTHGTTIQKILSFCFQNFEKNLTQKQVSQTLFISERQLTNIFSSRLHCSFRGYINQLRVNKAAGLLKNTNMKIIDIMYDCGFENQSSFNRIFYNIKGMTPSEYRKKAKKA